MGFSSVVDGDGGMGRFREYVRKTRISQTNMLRMLANIQKKKIKNEKRKKITFFSELEKQTLAYKK